MSAPASRPMPAPRPSLTERHVLALGLGMSGVFVAAATVVAVLSITGGGQPWAAIHLAMAGAATVAIGAFMPHFAVTLAGTRPAPAPARLAALGLLALGGLGAVLGVTLLGGPWALGGAIALLGGLGLVAWHTFAPLRDPLARRHPIVAATYGVALVELAAGVLLGGLGALGVPWVASGWANLRPAHAWLTLFGAVSTIIFGTLVYLAPTVLGARIRPSFALAAGMAGMLIGPPLTVAGFATVAAPLAIAGMAATTAGAIGQIGFVVDTWRRRGRYTSEHDWRRVAIGHLLAGPAWFALAVGVALAEIIGGRQLAGWSIGALAVPMVAGWMLQELVGSWTHLAPSVTPGDPAVDAAQRRALAVGSRSRLVAWNAGVGLAWAGLALTNAAVATVGFVLLGGSVALAIALLLRALLVRGR